MPEAAPQSEIGGALALQQRRACAIKHGPQPAGCIRVGGNGKRVEPQRGADPRRESYAVGW